jgi:hypothetical protein
MDEPDALLKFLDGCRARGVLAIEAEFSSGVKVKANMMALQQNELPADPEARKRLLDDPRTPEEVKQRLAAEDEEDLFASA